MIQQKNYEEKMRNGARSSSLWAAAARANHSTVQADTGPYIPNFLHSYNESRS